MANIYIIAPYHPLEWRESRSDLKIDPKNYARRLEEYWDAVELTEPPPGFLVSWIIPGKGGAGISCRLHADGQIVAMDVPVEEFILWHRKLIPIRHKLFLFPENASKSLELTQNTTLEEIREFLRREH